MKKRFHFSLVMFNSGEIERPRFPRLIVFSSGGYKQYQRLAYGRVAESVDATDLKSVISNGVRVQVPLLLPYKKKAGVSYG